MIAYHQWKADWWQEQSPLRNHEDATILSGVFGYAHKQAAICDHIAKVCALYWLPHLKSKGIIPGWASDYEHLLQATHSCDTANVDVESDLEQAENTNVGDVGGYKDEDELKFEKDDEMDPESELDEDFDD